MHINFAMLVVITAFACASCSAPDPYTNDDSLQLRRGDSSKAFLGCLESFDTGTMRTWATRDGGSLGRDEVINSCKCFEQKVGADPETLSYFHKAMFDCTDRHCVTSACKSGSEQYEKRAKEQKQEEERRQLRASGEAAMPREDAKKMVMAFINLNGELCAEIVSSRPLALPDTAEVTCIEYRGGSNQVTYIINMRTGHLEKGG